MKNKTFLNFDSGFRYLNLSNFLSFSFGFGHFIQRTIFYNDRDMWFEYEYRGVDVRRGVVRFLFTD